MSWQSVLTVLGWRRGSCRAVVGVVAGGWRGGVLVAGSGSSSSTHLDTVFSLATFALVVRGSTPRIIDYKQIVKSYKIIPSLSYENYIVFNLDERIGTLDAIAMKST